MEEEILEMEILPLVGEVYNIVRDKLYSIIYNREDLGSAVKYLYTDHPSSISIYSGFSPYLGGAGDYDIDGDVILVHQKGGDDLERFIDIEILFFEPFWITEDDNSKEAKYMVKNMIVMLNYDIPRFIRRIEEKISKEIRLGPYLILFNEKKARGNFIMNPIQSKYNIGEHPPYYWSLNEDAETLSIILPFRIINEEAYAPGGKEYERVRRETMIGK